ncbi:hypothetical protein [Actinomadura madurae]|nr:hypothetical protein [Actinomadura madurae]MCP9981382.1 hypothetical protein [Actinomadura madurae]MCQ0017584.1 hypothetical protein [Actinomadura madurae]
MKPLDPRLLRYARTTRLFLLASVALGSATAGPDHRAGDPARRHAHARLP